MILGKRTPNPLTAYPRTGKRVLPACALVGLAVLVLSWCAPWPPIFTAHAQASPGAKPLLLATETRLYPGIRLEFASRDRRLADLLGPAMVEDRTKVMERLRMFPQQPLRVVLAPTREAFARLAGGEPGAGTLGLYLLGQGVIVIRAPRTEAAGRWDPRGVLRHELAHAVLDQSVGAGVPIWLHEGLAILVSEGLDYLDETRLTLAAVTGGLIPLEVLMHRFPREHSQRDLAYAQAASFVRFLIRREGMGGILRMLHSLKNGQSSESAFRSGYGHSLGDLERQWGQELTGQFSYWSLATSTSLLGGLGIPLLLIAGLRRWVLKRRKFRQWEAEERNLSLNLEATAKAREGEITTVEDQTRSDAAGGDASGEDPSGDNGTAHPGGNGASGAAPEKI